MKTKTFQTFLQKTELSKHTGFGSKPKLFSSGSYTWGQKTQIQASALADSEQCFSTQIMLNQAEQGYESLSPTAQANAPATRLESQRIGF